MWSICDLWLRMDLVFRLFRWLFFQCMFCARFDWAISIHSPEIQHKNIPKHPPIIALEMAISRRPFEVPSGEPDFCMKGGLKKQSASFIASATGCPGPTYQLMKFEQLTGWRDILHLQPRGKTMVPIWFPVNRDSLPFNQSRCGKGMNFDDVRVYSA